MEPAQDKSIGTIMGALVIIIVLFATAIYAFASRVNRESATNASGNATSTVQFQTITNSADDVQSLKNDLNNSVK